MSDNHGCEIKFEIVKACNPQPFVAPMEIHVNTLEELFEVLTSRTEAIIDMPSEVYFEFLKYAEPVDEENAE